MDAIHAIFTNRSNAYVQGQEAKRVVVGLLRFFVFPFTKSKQNNERKLSVNNLFPKRFPWYVNSAPISEDFKRAVLQQLSCFHNQYWTIKITSCSS